MADKYTKGDSPSTDNKQVRITRSWSEAREESFTVADLERQIADCDNQIQSATDRKAELQAKIDEAEKVLAE
jgi:septal ring factor EnvC (AmiA/AmiB activator)